jgi:hypothetical protein
MGKARKSVCPYCGHNRKLTDDHVIPTCLFISPLPPSMITVKACHQCNNRKKSEDDSFLRDFLVMDAWGNNHPTAQQLFNGKVMRSIGYHKSELGPMVAAKARLKPFYSPHGVYLGQAVQLETPDRRLEQIISTIVRGLYFNALKQRLPDDCHFQIARHFFSWQLDIIKDVMGHLHMHGPRLLGDVFGCSYAIATEDPYRTMWILWFYNRVVYSVFTEIPQPLNSSPSL